MKDNDTTRSTGIAEFAGLDIVKLDNDGLENDRLEICGLVPAAPAAAAPQPRCCEVCLLAQIEPSNASPWSRAASQDFVKIMRLA